jgi:hypothetical protein
VKISGLSLDSPFGIMLDEQPGLGVPNENRLVRTRVS